MGRISTTANAQISFPVKFGAEPALAISFLSSYQGLGTANVRLEKGKGRYDVSGIWSDKTSQANTIFFRAAEKWHIGIEYAALEEAFVGDGLGGFGVNPNSSHILHITLLQSKKWQKF